MTPRTNVIAPAQRPVRLPPRGLRRSAAACGRASGRDAAAVLADRAVPAGEREAAGEAAEGA